MEWPEFSIEHVERNKDRPLQELNRADGRDIGRKEDISQYGSLIENEIKKIYLRRPKEINPSTHEDIQAFSSGLQRDPFDCDDESLEEGELEDSFDFALDTDITMTSMTEEIPLVGTAAFPEEENPAMELLSDLFDNINLEKEAENPLIEKETEENEKCSSSSPRSSHTEDMIHKISIYSKVSGCRMSNLSEQIIIKQLRVAILEKLVAGDYNQVGFYRFAFEKLKNGGLQVISSDKALIDAIGTLKYFAGIPVKMTFPDTPRVVGFIRNLPVNIEPSELKDTIRENIPEVYSVRYVTERILGEGQRKSPCAFVSFNLRYLPEKVMLFGKEYELHVPNPMQCSRCCRYGHQGKQCRAQVRCLYCSESHSKFQCRSAIQVCVNCKEAHPANSHDCLVWQQGKLMNELRYRGGCSAEEAMSIASNGKIPLKKHNFICVEYFENQDAFFFEGLSDDSYGSDEFNGTGHSGAPKYHPRALQVQPFLDLLSEFYLRLVNYPNGGRPQGQSENEEKRSKEHSVAAKELKETIMNKLSEEN